MVSQFMAWHNLRSISRRYQFYEVQRFVVEEINFEV